VAGLLSRRPRRPRPAVPGCLSVNFASALLSMSAEVVHWERLRLAVPYVAMEIQAQRDKYRALREHALALVRG
jgi:dynein heavy chain